MSLGSRMERFAAAPAPADLPLPQNFVQAEVALRERFMQAMRQAASVVCVVSASGPAGRVVRTVSSFNSVSADPPLVLFSINRSSWLREVLAACKVFSISVLSHEQEHLADIFAGRPLSGEPFDVSSARWQPAHEQMAEPCLADASAGFGCSLDAMIAAGTHEIVLGRVCHVVRTDAPPLLYWRRCYTRPERAVTTV